MADEKQLTALFDKMVDRMDQALDAPYVNKDGLPSGIPGSTLNVIRQFLKDQGISAVPAKGSKLEGLAKKALPFRISGSELEEHESQRPN